MSAQLSILSRMPAVEVLSLRFQIINFQNTPTKNLKCSINKINTLKYFKKTKKIRELYLRRNEISDLSELGFLMGLPDLKVCIPPNWLQSYPKRSYLHFIRSCGFPIIQQQSMKSTVKQCYVHCRAYWNLMIRVDFPANTSLD